MQSVDVNTAKRLARQRLCSLNWSGVSGLPKPKGTNQFEFEDAPAVVRDGEVEPKAPAIGEAGGGSYRAASVVTTAPLPIMKRPDSVVPARTKYDSTPGDQAFRIAQLAIIQAEVAGCTRCSELAASRQNTVFGIGNPQPQLCFVGEGPGADEDRVGEPFVGAAGQLLNRIIEACGMNRSEVYILNTVKCRPPGNRNPNEIELENCWPFAVRQLEILQPEFICCLGSVAAKTLLQSKESIGRMRGRLFEYCGSQVVVTYHPAYLLRNPSAKRQVWDDMKFLLAAMGREV